MRPDSICCIWPATGISARKSAIFEPAPGRRLDNGARYLRTTACARAWCTLSACETGMNKIFAGDEILGLARGFLSAGAWSLVLSLWTVSDEATSRLMKCFYENLQLGHRVAASLRIAQIGFIKARRASILLVAVCADRFMIEKFLRSCLFSNPARTVRIGNVYSHTVLEGTSATHHG